MSGEPQRRTKTHIPDVKNTRGMIRTAESKIPLSSYDCEKNLPSLLQVHACCELWPCRSKRLYVLPALGHHVLVQLVTRFKPFIPVRAREAALFGQAQTAVEGDPAYMCQRGQYLLTWKVYQSMTCEMGVNPS